MVDALRKPFFVVALLLLLLVVSTEIGGGLAVSGSYAGNICNKLPNDDDIRKECDPDEANGLKEDVPGLAISYLALVDGVLLFTVGLMGASLLLPDSIHGRIQGIITLIFAILLILASIALIFVALVCLSGALLMSNMVVVFALREFLRVEWLTASLGALGLDLVLTVLFGLAAAGVLRGPYMPRTRKTMSETLEVLRDEA